ncbi:uncharacterized protein TEOVI_000089900 [Trypanosoma equiperdum]|uniref:Uncharacterized protein n=2 Tax=Trypanozoon TaxID=39700 RepID=Q383Y3_TRYB2|nr:hypothetical protein, conserved [Trypanosoma brucei brucei TREU927]EAN79898.1 hypothetical protein, conserved [Trypanosoma brucei brucei TREU927]SCU69333.1 hypothetical protein, conserved [Trypanosoma equiperdum]
MTKVWMPWAYQALLAYAHSGAAHGQANLWLKGQTSTPLQRICDPVPNLLISQSSQGGQRALWLLHRPESVLGLVVSPQWQGESGDHELCDASVVSKRKIVRVMKHLHSLPFRVAGSSPLRPPMVVHKNHLVGWRIDGKAAPLYAHTLDQLAKLKPTQFKTIEPKNAFICRTYYEWDNWKEVSMEPGWTWHHVDEEIANNILDGTLTFDGLRATATDTP